jgi:hypothetical protein
MIARVDSIISIETDSPTLSAQKGCPHAHRTPPSNTAMRNTSVPSPSSGGGATQGECNYVHRHPSEPGSGGGFLIGRKIPHQIRDNDHDLGGRAGHESSLWKTAEVSPVASAGKLSLLVKGPNRTASAAAAASGTTGITRIDDCSITATSAPTTDSRSRGPHRQTSM